MHGFRRGVIIRGGFVAGGSMPLSPDRWRPSAPIIQNGKVVFTAFDGDGEALHCLNLRDGRLLWHIKREDDDLYLAGVFGPRVLIVGKSYARALNLDDGKELWQAGHRHAVRPGRGERQHLLPAARLGGRRSREEAGRAGRSISPPASRSARRPSRARKNRSATCCSSTASWFRRPP